MWQISGCGGSTGGAWWYNVRRDGIILAVLVVDSYVVCGLCYVGWYATFCFSIAGDAMDSPVTISLEDKSDRVIVIALCLFRCPYASWSRLLKNVLLLFSAVGCPLGSEGCLLFLFDEGWRDDMPWMRLGAGEWVMKKMVEWCWVDVI